LVVDEPNATYRPTQEIFLFEGGIEAVSEGFQYHVSHFSAVFVNFTVEAALPPTARSVRVSGGLRAEE